MAHSDNPRFKLMPHYDVPLARRDGVQSFRYFMDPNEGYNPVPYPDRYTHQEAIRYTPAEEALVGDCLLDYVYVWLASGTAGRDCPTFESYLIAIIGIVDDYYNLVIVGSNADPDELQALRQAHGRDFPVLCSGSTSWAWDHVQTGTEWREWQQSRVHNPEGFDHPALRREVFEYYRARIWEEEMQRRIEKAVGGYPADSQ